MLRTHTCGELNEKHVGLEVILYGWVDSVRDHGGLLFVDLRDRYGKTQLVASGEGWVVGHSFKSEDCIRVRGKVQPRPKGTENSKIPTGQIEVAIEFPLLDGNFSSPLPFEITKSCETNEELRMTHRYLDLRNPAVQKNLFLRHRVCQIIRHNFDKHGFIEVETPILTKSTPEGARDYLVPSRVNEGEFYALPQSPQLFKQILMVSGFDRYFQIAKCFRDEDLRADRQPEFTQLDIEMSFLDEEDLFKIVEETLGLIWKDVAGVELAPFTRLTYQEAMMQYGSDKPDLRFGLKIHDASEIVKNSDFKIFKEVANSENSGVLGICVPKPEVSRKDIDALTEFAKSEGAFGLAYFKVEEGKLDSPIAKFLDEKTQKNLIHFFKAQPGDLLLFVADEKKKGRKVLGALRLYLSKWKGYVKPNTFHFSWVTDFPLFQWNAESKRWDSEHHPFTCPNLEDWEKYRPSGEFGSIRSRAYDLVLNGNEIASGSIRIHKKELQREIFERIGLSHEDIEGRFGFLLGAFQYGTPPHGGIALGIDRVMTLLLGLDSIREVIAFPKNQKAVDPMTKAPSPVDDKQLRELHIKLRS